MFARKLNKVTYSYHFSLEGLGLVSFSSFFLLRKMGVKYLMAIRENVSMSL